MSRQVYATLRRRGLAHDDAQDVVQDVAEKITHKRVPFNDAADLARFAHHAARHLRIDRQRAEERRATASVADLDHVAMDAIDVIESLTARRAWWRLSAPDRATLLNADMPATRPGEYDRRYHARRRLLLILASLETWLALPRRVLRRLRPKAPQVVAAAVTAIVLTAAVNHALHIRPPDAGGAPTRPVTTRAPTATTVGQAGTDPGRSRPSASAATPTPYDERVRLPTGRVVIGPGDDGLAEAESEPTREDDALICFGGNKIIKITCVGSATHPLPVP